MYVCMDVDIYVRIYVRMYECMYLCTHIFMYYVGMYLCMYACMYVFISLNFQIVQPNVRSRDPLRSASNNEIHIPSFSHIRTRTLWIRTSLNKEKRITEK